jgi:hypothetical protein
MDLLPICLLLLPPLEEEEEQARHHKVPRESLPAKL